MNPAHILAMPILLVIVATQAIVVALVEALAWISDRLNDLGDWVYERTE